MAGDLVRNKLVRSYNEPQDVYVDRALYIGGTSNANMTTGITIQQAGADNQVLAFKSTDVNHGMTGSVETDTYGSFGKVSGTQGGLAFTGYSENETALSLGGAGVNDDTGKATTANGYINLAAFKKSGTGVTTPGADANLVTISANATTRFIFDTEGSAHADIEWVAFDTHDDLAVIEDMESLLAPDQVKRQFGEVVKHDREFFEQAGLLHDVREVEPGKMRGMLNTTKAMMLAFGAMRQLGGRIIELENQLAAVRQPPALPAE